ncbi:MAG TPA: helix-turn-helix domain-containing protein [Firmicutes bacterium]|nr:helix-turn-helix domain-containing protein [Bacillota bacterium]
MTKGERIKARREALGLSVGELAERLNKNRATIYRYESGEIEDMPITVLEPLAKALNTTPAYIMGWEEEPLDFEGLLNALSQARSRPDSPEIAEAVEKLINPEPRVVIMGYDGRRMEFTDKASIDFFESVAEALKKKQENQD